MSNQYNLPASTAALLNDHINKCKNLALILDKYPPQAVVAETKNKGPWLQNLVKGSPIDTTLTLSAYTRWHTMMTAIVATLFNATLDWRMVIGLGGESVLETDITLHHLYGIPFVPGSALKGLTRAYAAEEYKEYYVPEAQPAEKRKASKKIDDDHSEIKRIFGSQKQAGTVIFFDAMPLNGITNFVLDIMNPHYPDYYNSLNSNKTTPPTNDLNPNPITFLTVTNTTFTFALAPRNPKDPEHKDHVQKVSAWLQKAIEKYGVGGKTSAGYGYFKMVKEGETAPSSKLEEKTSQPKPAERIRPNIPQFKEGQEITGSVLPLTEDLRSNAPAGAKALLRYQSFSTRDILIAVSTEEAQNWKPGETRICLFVHEEVQDGCTVLVCQPRPSKKKKG